MWFDIFPRFTDCTKRHKFEIQKNHRSLASNVMKLFDKVELRGEVNNFPFGSTSKSKSKGF
jgi:hypothetical protein